jgi:hypothetical protein
MSVSTHVVGIIPANETWQKMKDVWDACKKAGVAPPAAVIDFFDDKVPDPSGVVVEIDHHNWFDKSGSASGIEVKLDELPPHVETIRFFNSW